MFSEEASVDPTEARNVAGSGPVPSDPGRPNPSPDRATDGRTPAFTSDGPGDPIRGHGEADRPGRRSDGDRGAICDTSRFFPTGVLGDEGGTDGPPGWAGPILTADGGPGRTRWEFILIDG